MPTTRRRPNARTGLMILTTSALFLALFVSACHAAPIPHRLEGRRVDCVVPAQWYHILTFFLINYALHAMTVTSVPGEKAGGAALFNLGALLLPFTGVSRGLDAIRKGAIFGKTSLERAQRAGALCVVTRDPERWRPSAADVVSGCIAPIVRESAVTGNRKDEKLNPAKVTVSTAPSSTSREAVDSISEDNPRADGETEVNDGIENPTLEGKYHITKAKKQIDPTNVNIQGYCRLPRGYTLNVLPPNVRLSSKSNDKIDLSCSYNFVKAVASIVQVLFGAFTLWRARGDQLDRYGYASFGLTVIPYILMSFINLLGNAFTPTYPTIFILGSEVLDEARRRTEGASKRRAEFDGIVGYLPTYGNPEIDTPALGNASIRFENNSDPNLTAGPTVFGNGERLEWPTKYRIVRRTDTPLASDYIQPTIEVPALGPHFLRPHHRTTKFLDNFSPLLTVIVLAAPYALIGGLTRFDPRSSSSLERGFTMAWLVVGQVAGALMASSMKADKGNIFERSCLFVTFVIFFGAPTVGGMIFVGKMYREFGACVSV